MCRKNGKKENVGLRKKAIRPTSANFFGYSFMLVTDRTDITAGAVFYQIAYTFYFVATSNAVLNRKRDISYFPEDVKAAVLVESK